MSTENTRDADALRDAQLAYASATVDWSRALDRVTDEASRLGLLYVANASQASLDGQSEVVRECQRRADLARAAALVTKARADVLAGDR